jgi:predicted transcriptional regulator
METKDELLKIIQKHQGITLTQIYKNSKKSYATIQTTIKTLEKEKLITRKTEGRTKKLYTKKEATRCQKQKKE